MLLMWQVRTPYTRAPQAATIATTKERTVYTTSVATPPGTTSPALRAAWERQSAFAGAIGWSVGLERSDTEPAEID